MPAALLSSTPERWLIVPTPDEAYWTPSGCDFASAISSRTLFAGSEGCATSICGALARRVIGARSLPKSKLRLFIAGLMVWATVHISKV